MSGVEAPVRNAERSISLGVHAIVAGGRYGVDQRHQVTPDSGVAGLETAAGAGRIM